MPYWVYGRDATSGAADQMLSDAATPEAAREQATAQGMIVERIEPAPATPDLTSREPPFFRVSRRGVIIALAAACLLVPYIFPPWIEITTASMPIRDDRYVTVVTDVHRVGHLSRNESSNHRYEKDTALLAGECALVLAAA